MEPTASKDRDIKKQTENLLEKSKALKERAKSTIKKLDEVKEQIEEFKHREDVDQP
ncbi:hypothetical protein [Pedobacter xixiisoli]|uniref:Uncharacterized protein n=1 Tax=Pedobacter xixiisoli TaxID=1476464 RepID=A0A285ZWF1_9SPHI|nr:hypothetical protein [Pedobacter xixiisoli]SOD13972.1 hypothetical protein SAMN06297358_1337 [Pedobacter xixiisoli]